MGKSSREKPSLLELVNYRIQKIKTSFDSNLSSVSWSENTSTTSLSSVTSASTAATSIEDENEYYVLEDLLVLKTNAQNQHAFTQRQENFRDDLLSHLNGSLHGHSYMARLRLVGKDSFSFRPALLFKTKSAKTKLSLASCLRASPSLLRRLPETAMDIHIVFSRFGSSCSTEDLESDFPVLDSFSQLYFSVQPVLNGGLVTVTDDYTGTTASFVAGGRLLLDKEPVLTGVYHSLATFDKTQKDWQQAMSIIIDDDGFEEHKGAISIYFDDVFNPDEHVKLHGEFVHLAKELRHSDSKASVSISQCCGLIVDTPDEQGQLTQELFQAHVCPAIIQRDVSSPSSYDKENDSMFTPQIIDTTSDIADGPFEAQLVKHSIDADWTLLKTNSNLVESNRSTGQANEIGGYIIDKCLPQGTRLCRDVTVALPSGEVSGCLQPDHVFYQVGIHKYKLKVISLDSPLQRGCSGAWVTYRNMACGVIIAINDDLPEAYILPFDTMIEDMEKSTGKVVRFPLSNNGATTSPQIDLFVNQVEEHTRTAIPEADLPRISAFGLTNSSQSQEDNQQLVSTKSQDTHATNYPVKYVQPYVPVTLVSRLWYLLDFFLYYFALHQGEIISQFGIDEVKKRQITFVMNMILAHRIDVRADEYFSSTRESYYLTLLARDIIKSRTYRHDESLIISMLANGKRDLCALQFFSMNGFGEVTHVMDHYCDLLACVDGEDGSLRRGQFSLKRKLWSNLLKWMTIVGDPLSALSSFIALNRFQELAAFNNDRRLDHMAFIQRTLLLTEAVEKLHVLSLPDFGRKSTNVIGIPPGWHQDLKPTNILHFVGSSNPSIADIGLCQCDDKFSIGNMQRLRDIEWKCPILDMQFEAYQAEIRALGQPYQMRFVNELRWWLLYRGLSEDEFLRSLRSEETDLGSQHFVPKTESHEIQSTSLIQQTPIKSRSLRNKIRKLKSSFRHIFPSFSQGSRKRRST